ncbi:hypothetical protein PC123_g4819 [Phytophthora cactorum]|nr:hypothetical protein PC123_g4819 [Phytophthora cactorum]
MVSGLAGSTWTSLSVLVAAAHISFSKLRQWQQTGTSVHSSLSTKARESIAASSCPTTAKIVHSSALKKRIVKICDGEKLSAAESAALKRFETPRSDEQPGASGRKRKERQDSYSAHVIQQGVSKRCQVERAAFSPLAALVPPTSNACEHLFSECKITLTPQRCSMLPAHFEMLTFLCVNKDMWDVTSLI